MLTRDDLEKYLKLFKESYVGCQDEYGVDVMIPIDVLCRMALLSLEAENMSHEITRYCNEYDVKDEMVDIMWARDAYNELKKELGL